MTNTPMMHIFLKQLQTNYLMGVQKCQTIGVQLRPHIKTLHSPKLCEPLKALGLSKISVSNTDMLLTFLEAGWDDICLAIPCSPSWVNNINQFLQDYSCQLLLYVDHLDQLTALDGLARPVSIMVEVDAGQARSGVHWKHEERMCELINQILKSQHEFAGLSAHFGHHYDCVSTLEIKDEMSFSMMRVLQLKEHLEYSFKISIPLAIGDTPSFLALNYFDCVSELRPGNFLLNDLTMVHKGLCDVNQLACAIRASIIGKYDDDLRIVLHVGAVHLSKEKHRDTTINYGWVALPDDNGLGELIQGAFITDLYQEHAVLKIPPEWVSRLHIGDELYILPVHSCLAMDAMIHKNKFVLVE